MVLRNAGFPNILYRPHTTTYPCGRTDERTNQARQEVLVQRINSLEHQAASLKDAIERTDLQREKVRGVAKGEG